MGLVFVIACGAQKYFTFDLLWTVNLSVSLIIYSLPEHINISMVPMAYNTVLVWSGTLYITTLYSLVSMHMNTLLLHKESIEAFALYR